MMTSEEKNQKLQHPGASTSPLLSLPPDALTSVLCRVPASDHTNLRKTCKTVRKVIDSDEFRFERAATDTAEVMARLISGEEMYNSEYPDGPELDDDSYDPDADNSDVEENEEEKAERIARRRRWEERKQARRQEDLQEYYSDLGHYDDSYGYEDITVEITIDGAKSGSITLVLIPRPDFGTLFLEACDAHSQELQEVGWALCNNRGSPKIRSIKEADVDGNAKRGGYLHVVKVDVPDVYIKGGTTNVVSKALRAALTVPELEGKWTLATAVSDRLVYMTKEEAKERSEIMRNDDTDPAEKKRLSDRWTECVELDAKTFIRVGYKQIPEVLEKDKSIWLFALPSFFKQAVLTPEEAEAITLIGPPNLPAYPSGVDDELFAIVKQACNSCMSEKESFACFGRQMAEMEDELQKMRREVTEEFDRNAALIETSAQAGENSESQLEQWQALRDTLAQKRTTMESKIQQSLAKLQREKDNTSRVHHYKLLENANNMKAKVKDLVNKKEASIRKSFSLHCASRFVFMEYLDFLLELVPAHERQAAINDFDMNGLTPLHCLLLGTPEPRNVEIYYDAVQHLIECGASRDTVDTSGRTALGQFRLTMIDKMNYDECFGLLNEETRGMMTSFSERVELALMPIMGETDADRDALGDDDDLDLNEDSDEEFDVEDFDDEDLDDEMENGAD